MRAISFLLVILGVGMPLTAYAASIDNIIARFEGQYRGSVSAAAMGQADASPITMHTFVKRVDAPVFGEDVIYMERRAGGPEGTIRQQRIFSFSEDKGDVITTAYDFFEPEKTGAKYARADAAPQRLTGLSPDTLYNFPAGCRIRWSEDGEEYVATVKRQDCQIESRFGWGTVYVDMVYRVSDTGYSLAEQGFNGDGDSLFGSADRQQHKRLPKTDLDAELEAILASFEGAFDNLEPEPGAPRFRNMIRSLYTKARRVDLPAFGSHVQYMEVTRGGPDGPMQRQRINVFDGSPDRSANVMVSYNFPDGNAYAGAYANPEILADLKPADLDPFEIGCELIWSENNGVFTGVADRASCHIFNENLQVWRHVSFIYMLDGESMHLWEHGYTPEGDFAFGSRMPIRFPRISSQW